MKCILASVFVSVRNWIFRPLLSLGYLNSTGINLNWRRTNLRKKEKQLSSQYDKYFGRVIIFRKDIIFERENILKSDSIFLLRCYVSLFLCFLKVSRQFFCLDTFGRQADEYITRGVMFFMNLCTGFSQNVLAVQKWIHSGYIYY